MNLLVYDIIFIIRCSCTILGEGSSSCAVHLMNEGISINGGNVSIYFVGIGPVESYFCRIDRSPFLPCEFDEFLILPDGFLIAWLK